MIFLLAPLREGRPEEKRGKSPIKRFLLTSLREGRQNSRDFFRGGKVHFYSRPYAWGDKHGEPDALPRDHISTHVPTRGATGSAARRLRLNLFLLPPLREGRSAVEGSMRYNRIISIHAPTRGTTAIFTKPQVDLYDKLLKNSHFLYTPAFV